MASFSVDVAPDTIDMDDSKIQMYKGTSSTPLAYLRFFHLFKAVSSITGWISPPPDYSSAQMYASPDEAIDILR